MPITQMPYSTSRTACSRVSATCMTPTSRQAARSTVVPYVAARSSMTFQWCANASNPSAVSVAPIDSRPRPWRPARRGPGGDATAATATSNIGSLYGRSCNPRRA
ncbi:hypothetical protein [Nonomuraea aurantiaca]|uniref:hypothetical protein n=1 Tax=Nonomuraea aurantiaca TaxID=2878562 RepID=UPI001CD9A056|nr:hypothetical protein [Nonomuraea aurantiaca]MCA2220389.1 hypothetical protein [Nonomuraea aurantiaca]